MFQELAPASLHRAGAVVPPLRNHHQPTNGIVRVEHTAPVNVMFPPDTAHVPSKLNVGLAFNKTTKAAKVAAPEICSLFTLSELHRTEFARMMYVPVVASRTGVTVMTTFSTGQTVLALL